MYCRVDPSLELLHVRPLTLSSVSALETYNPPISAHQHHVDDWGTFASFPLLNLYCILALLIPCVVATGITVTSSISPSQTLDT